MKVLTAKIYYEPLSSFARVNVVHSLVVEVKELQVFGNSIRRNRRDHAENPDQAAVAICTKRKATKRRLSEETSQDMSKETSQDMSGGM